ncbi:hypothetical protein AVEN_45706-1 [Araneus ventricosus]|uniref:Uncharacterized protein n=1 Tax=Araneus ventricosus TaxID=182803 RepID=A0A4Y2V6F1_ARAVE|nr:hypothetical protein AVEN_45706-1 [Araneus ventricosus]
MANVGKRKAFSIGSEKHGVNAFSQNEIEHFERCDDDVITSGEEAKRPSISVMWKLGDVVPAQMSFSSSDHGFKKTGRSQNSPRVSSKRDVNITKLNYMAFGYLINVTIPLI